MSGAALFSYGLESLKSRLIVPPNGGGGGGRYLPSIVVVASGEPGVPVVCTWAYAAGMPTIIIPANDNASQLFLSVSMTDPFRFAENNRSASPVSGPHLAGIFRRDRQQGNWTKGQLKRDLNAMSALGQKQTFRGDRPIVSLIPRFVETDVLRDARSRCEARGS